MAGAHDLVIAAGVESMTRVPMWSSIPDPEAVYGSRFRERYGLGDDGFICQALSGEIIAERWEITRAELDGLALESHRRAGEATAAGRFDAEIVPIRVRREDDEEVVTADEGIRPSTSLEALAALRPVFREDGRRTAGNSPQIRDGAGALLIASETAAARLGLRPIARFHSFALAGVDPVEMLSGPIPARRKVLDRAALELDDIELAEVNEMGRRGARHGLQTMCEGGGMANATILKLV